MLSGSRFRGLLLIVYTQAPVLLAVNMKESKCFFEKIKLGAKMAHSLKLYRTTGNKRSFWKLSKPHGMKLTFTKFLLLGTVKCRAFSNEVEKELVFEWNLSNVSHF